MNSGCACGKGYVEMKSRILLKSETYLWVSPQPGTKKALYDKRFALPKTIAQLQIDFKQHPRI
jgi:hypothetical protein